jgi:GNAT superfamily N-acetyltransferase
MFDGVESPMTQSFGLGLFETVADAELTQVERFFEERHAPIYHEISPLADAALLALLPARGYQPLEYTNVLYLPLSLDYSPALVRNPQLRARRITSDEGQLWARTAAAGWSTEAPGLSEFILALGEISVQSVGTEPFLAELAGEPVAAGGLFIHEGVALLMGASTLPASRRQGSQSALLAARLLYAAGKGCTLAMMAALPGSQSQRNAEKNGFRIAYTRIKWHLGAAAT